VGRRIHGDMSNRICGGAVLYVCACTALRVRASPAMSDHALVLRIEPLGVSTVSGAHRRRLRASAMSAPLAEERTVDQPYGSVRPTAAVPILITGNGRQRVIQLLGAHSCDLRNAIEAGLRTIADAQSIAEKSRQRKQTAVPRICMISIDRCANNSHTLNGNFGS